ncbi:hypothetical protein [Mycolicibacterium porcinum]|uniref:hypothetical protein n=1 Tax=Mycolicibacterium porcinum TaxID=39693 RepID=UPI000848BBA2|nr:hypothetical protein [Mycolicibacterium porcinum]ODR25788.1 hypothetical protein BHQ19_10170 [Mycolicibacterium porcinum]
MRSLKSIQAAEEEFFDRVWYERRLVMLELIRAGQEEMASEDIMDGMTKAMRDCEDKYGDSLQITSEFEAGMLSGKLSALRWVLGEDWDNLDT